MTKWLQDKRKKVYNIMEIKAAKKIKNMLDILLDTHVKNSFQVYKCITDCKDPLWKGQLYVINPQTCCNWLKFWKNRICEKIYEKCVSM